MSQIFREIKSHISFRKVKNPDFPAHIHDDIELVFVKRGEGAAGCDGKKYMLSDNMWFLTFPNQVHYYTDFIPGEYYVLILKPTALLRYNGVFLAGAPECAVHTDSSILWLLETAFQEHQQDGFSEIIAAYLTALFGKLLPHYPIEKAPFPRDTVQRILQYCADHYREELTVGTVAERLSVSRSCVSHIFSSRIGVNFCDYINTLRLTDAEELLRNGNYTVTEIANLSGFTTIRTFNRAFLKKHGISPSAYRNALQK